ncbi:hypothetical protein BISA_1432 [Bifidobacterium saguini DSM 23967]|uniref:Uncharacterized protein n=2 Tax=Bifidobacterium saguini TaxID=762210 RepID=A0A087DCU6_9BIFI|nr:hypothetical protein [Bifidobacterium saguini]KFI93346.1 hypothetical protein BISA_1432 [Bifidobacterium saguini DSM 23967]QTB90557.1 hypothetical protein BSD967_09600 [Bifidobacterium saguini]
MADNTDDKNPDNESHFSDEELEAALAGFEKEFADEDANKADATDASGEAATTASTDDVASVADAVNEAMADVIDPSVGFDNELAGLLGNKAKIALIVTRIAAADLLAAFCQLSDISAECIGSNQGAVAVLKNLDGDGPEAAAKDLTTVVSGMAVVLAVNRADKLEATMYMQGEAGQTFAPPVLFNSTPRFVEDLMLGIVTLVQLKSQGFEVVNSAELDHDQAMEIIAKHTKQGRAGRGSRIE